MAVWFEGISDILARDFSQVGYSGYKSAGVSFHANYRYAVSSEQGTMEMMESFWFPVSKVYRQILVVLTLYDHYPCKFNGEMIGRGLM